MGLSDAEVAQLVDALFEGDRRPDAQTLSGLVNLVALRGVDTADVAASAAAAYWPAFFTKDASAETRDDLLAQAAGADIGDAGDANRLLLALAFIGDATIVERFHAWEASPPPWQGMLPATAAVYARQAGWSLLDHGARRELTFPDAVATRRADASEAGAGARSGVTIGGMLDEQCPSCGSDLVNALTLDGDDPRFAFLGVHGVLRVPACPWCTMFKDASGSLGSGVMIWVRYDSDGSSVLDVVGRPDHDRGDYQELMDQEWIPDPVATGPWRAHADIAEVPVIGGQPMWLQDAEYAECPQCRATMRHLAWIPPSCLVSDGAEGIWYVHVCTDCRVATVIYQQT